MALNPSNSSNLEQLALKGLNIDADRNIKNEVGCAGAAQRRQKLLQHQRLRQLQATKCVDVDTPLTHQRAGTTVKSTIVSDMVCVLDSTILECIHSNLSQYSFSVYQGLSE